MDERIIVAGSGGQGVLTLGIFLSKIGILEGRNVSWLPTYGAEKRGGFSFCYICVSDTTIYSPIIDSPTALIAFDQRAYETYRPKINDKTAFIENSSLVTGQKDPGRKFSIPASKLSNDINFMRGLNIMLAGAMIEASGIFKHDSSYAVMEEMLHGKSGEIMEKNFMAYGVGVKYVKDRAVFADINEGVNSVKEMFSRWLK